MLPRRKPTTSPKLASSPDNDQELNYRPIDRAMIARLLGYMKPYRRRYVKGISLGMLTVLLEMLGPRFVQHLVDWTTGYVEHVPATDWSLKALERVSRALSGSTETGVSHAHAVAGVLVIIAVWALSFVGAVLLHRAAVLIMTRAGESVQFDLRRRIFGHLQSLSMNYYDRTKLGRIISRCTSDLGSLREMNVWGVDQIVRNSLTMAVAATSMLMLDWRLFLAVAWLAPVLLAMNQFFKSRISGAWQQVREHFSRVSTNMAENITGVRVVTAFHRQSPNLDVFDDLQDKNTRNNIRAAKINGVYHPMLQVVGFMGKVIILTYGGYLAATGRVDRVGRVVAAFLYWDWFMNPVLNFGNLYNNLLMAMAGGERIFQLLDTQPEVKDQPGAADLPRVEGAVKFDHVTFGYKPETPVLHDIDFEAKPGQMIALVGSTGSGKSSIISLIARFYLPQRGKILVDGHDTRGVTGRSLHKQMGLVLQNNYLFTGTVLDNIRYPRPEASREEVIEAAKEIGSYDAICALRDGFDTEVGERGGSMSLGQRQLICFTRAYLANPRIFLLDEATSAVDTATELQIQNALERLLEGRTTFIVAHRLSTILRADTILVIDQGRIIERGTHSQLLSTQGKYAQLYEQFASANEED